MKAQQTQRKRWRRASRILLKTILFTFLFLLFIIILIHTPPVQRLFKNKVVAFLEKKLNTRVEIGRVNFVLPKKLVLSDIYVEDQQKDTLISGGTIRANLSFFKLFSNEIEIDNLQVQDLTAKVKRVLPDTAFNFKFIIDAFAVEKKKDSDTTTTAPLKLALDHLTLENININYKDVLTGDDLTMHLGMLNARIDSLEPFENHYEIPTLLVDGLKVRFHQQKPLVDPEPIAKDIAEAARQSNIHLKFDKADLRNIDLSYGNEVSAFYTQVKFSKLLVDAKFVDLPNRILHFENIELADALTSIRLGEKEQARIVQKEIEQEVEVQRGRGWNFHVDKADFSNNVLAFENDNSPKQSYGIDFGHMKADSFNLHVENFVMNSDSIGGNIKQASFREKNGFVLQELRGEVLYANEQSYLKDLFLKTPGTELKRYALLKYDSYQDLAKNFERTQMEVDVSGSHVQVKDILAFAPALRRNAAFSNPNDVWYLDLQGSGTLATLHIDNLQFDGLKNTVIDARGSLATSNSPAQTGGTLYIRKLHTSQSDIALFTGRRLSTPQVNLPEEFDATGTVSGSMNNLTTNLNIATSMGSVAVNGRFTNLASPTNAGYTAVLKPSSLDLGKILRNPQLGRTSGNISVAGRGFTPNSIDTRFKGTLYSLRFNDYTYRNINVNGSLRRSEFNVYTDINDPNLAIEGTFTGSFSANSYFEFMGKADSVKLMPLGFTKEPVVVRGDINASVPLMNRDQLIADVSITNALFVSKDQRLSLDTVQFAARREGEMQYLDLTSDVAKAHIGGRFSYSDLGKIFQNSIQPYFMVGSRTAATVKPYDIEFNIDVINSPIFASFLPGLGDFETIHAEGTVATGIGLNTHVTTPYIIYSGNEIRGLNLNVTTTNAGLRFAGEFQRLQGKTLDLYRTEFNATALNNVFDFDVNAHDAADRTRYFLSGVLRQPVRGTYELSLHPDTLMLNYQQWSVLPGNSLTITKDNIVANNFTIQRGEQQLSLQTISNELQARVSNFQISTITAFMNSDSLMVNGSMTGVINFKNILRQPVFTSDLVINDLSFKGDTIGTATVKVDNLAGDRYYANATITGRGNDLSLTGTFQPQGDRDIALDLALNIRQLQLSTVEGAFGGFLKNASGSVSGNIVVGGSVNDPVVNGPVKFNNASFAISVLGSQFKIDGEELDVTENGFRFNDFVIRDTANNVLRLNGTVQTPNFTNFYFDLDVDAANFKVLHTTKKDNKIYYGDLVISTDMHVDGTEKNPIIDGDVTVNEGTNLTVVVPQREQALLQREGIVEFVDLDNPTDDSLFRAYDSLNIADVTGMNISTNIEIQKEAIFNLVIDEANGDFINLQGEAQLSTGIDPSGKITLVGSYEIERGAYEITFNFLHRRFDIEKGSRITWMDKPTNATLDVHAVYIANTSPIDLVQSQISAATPEIVNTYRQRLPFEVELHLTGEMLQPIVAFDIVLPTDRSYGVSNDIIVQVESRLSQLRQDPGEINKQVFSLLLLNRFVGPNPFDSESPAFRPSSYVRQSVSKLLTGELNKLAGSLIEGVDITFDVSSTDDYTTGQRRSRTDLNIGLTKRLLNERLTVTIGSNFEVQGPRNSSEQASNLLGNIAVNYLISRDGRYMLRFYRKNEYEGVVDGYVIETGLSFLITVDYDRISQLLKRRKNMVVEGVTK